MPRQFGVPEKVINDVLQRRVTIAEYSPYLSPIHPKHIIGVNAAFMIGDWIDVMLFGDGGIFRKNKHELAAFPGLRVTCHPHVHEKYKFDLSWIRYVPRDGKHPFGITTRRNHISWNLNTGAAAINLAVQMGAKRVILLGFDMKKGQIGEQRVQHWHTHYRRDPNVQLEDKKLPFQRFVTCFPVIKRDAKRLGIEILNVSNDTAIKEFPCVQLKEVL